MPSGKLTIRVTDYPQDIVDVKEVRLPSDISYNLITGHSDTLSYLYAEELIKHLLRSSKHQIIDLSLPYSYTNTQGKIQRLNARYIIFDNRLLAIRVKCGPKWAAGKVEYQRPPDYILDYYRQEGTSQIQDNIPVGHFYLQLNRCKIALFFQSQINEKPASLNLLEKFKFDIISVLCDVSNKANQIKITDSLKKISKKEIVTVVYAGLRIAPKPTLYYDSKSFIIQGGKQAFQDRFYLGQPRITQLLIDLQETFDKKISKMLQEKISKSYSSYQSYQSIESLRSILINCNVPNYDNLPQKEIPFIYNKEKFNQTLQKYQIQLLHLWYIFKTIHRGSPFVIPYPFHDASNRLFDNLTKLEQYANISIKKLVKVYCYKPNNIVNSKFEVTIYDSFHKMYVENINSFPKYAFVYSHDSLQLNAFKTNSKYRQIICNCSYLNPYCLQNKKYTTQQQHEVNQRRKRERACYDLLKNYETLDQILQYFLKINFYQKDIEICFTDILPRKVQENFKNTPLQYILLNYSKQQILKQIEPLWDIKKKKNQLSRNNTHSEGMALQNHSNSLQQKINECKKAKRNINNRKAKCHICSFYIRKEYIYECGKCKELMCYDCLYQRNERILMNQKQQYQCLICAKKCQCTVCQPKRLLEAQIKPVFWEEKNKQFEIEYCNICIVYQIKKRIFIECSQCKKQICFICEKRRKMLNFSNQQNSINQKLKIICRSCEQLNKQKNITSYFNPITIKQQEYQQQRQSKQIEIPVNNNLNKPERIDESANKVKERKKNSNVELKKGKSMQKIVDAIQPQKQKKKFIQSSSPSRSFSSLSSLSSSASILSSSRKHKSKRHKSKDRRNLRSKSRSRSRSRSREKYKSNSNSSFQKDNKSEKKQTFFYKKDTRIDRNQVKSNDISTKHRRPQQIKKQKKQEKLWPDPSKNTKRQVQNNKPDPRLAFHDTKQTPILKSKSSVVSVGQILPISYTPMLQQDHSY